METWEKCAHPVDPEKLKGRVCFGGLDLIQYYRHYRLRVGVSPYTGRR